MSKEQRPKLRYKGGLSRSSEYTPIDPKAVGFGDLVNNDSKQKFKTTRHWPAVARRKLYSSMQRLHNRVDLAAIKKWMTNIAKKPQPSPPPNTKPIYKHAYQKKSSSPATQSKAPPKSTNTSYFNIGNILLRARTGIRLLWQIVVRTDRRLVVGALVAIMVFVPLHNLLSSNSPEPDTTNNVEPQVIGATDPPTSTPFTGVFPIGIDEDEVEPFYDSQRGILSYQTRGQSGDVIITEQQLPTEFKEKPEQLKNLALSLNKKTNINRFETSKGLVYVAEAADSSQTAIFAYNDLLIFITSPRSLTPEEWMDFIDILQ